MKADRYRANNSRWNVAMDQMTFTKVIGGFCGALLVYLLGVWAAE
jgi:uncharacterized membrane protein YsdA (DUF1294 family)